MRFHPLSARSTKTAIASMTLLFAVVAGRLPSTVSATEAPAPSKEQIQRWVTQLDANEFWTREEATKQLYRAGRPAVAALAESARSDKLEKATRSIAILCRLLESPDPQTELAAETALEEIASARVTSAAGRAEAVLAGFRETQSERALSKLEQLGAQVVGSALPNGERAIIHVAIGEGWRGENADLAALKRIASIDRLSIYLPAVNDDSVKHLSGLRQLTTLELYGTRISDEGMQQITAALPNTKIDRRRGAMLGVLGQANQQGGGCRVRGVQSGTAAEKAGLRAGDVVIQFDGKSVDDFDMLTKAIAEKFGGETVELEINRNGEKVKKQVTLGQWKNDMKLGTGRLIVEDPFAPGEAARNER